MTAISAGDRFTLALLANGTVMAWGDNQYGQMGNGSTTYSALPVPVEGLVGVTAVAAGGGQSLAVLSDGKVMAWGDNQYGQLGNGTTTDSDVHEVVSGLSDVTAAASGSLHSMALLPNGTVDTWGDNGSGQLGDGTFHDRSKPGPVPGLIGVTQISAGQQFSVALESDGEVQSWGLQSVGVSTKLPTRVGNLTGVLQISRGWTATLALLPGGKVDGWNELTGIAPEPEPVSGAIAVAAGGEFSLALITNGTVQAWGDNALGQLGAGPSYPADGSGPVAVKGLTGATFISAGANHAVALVPPGDANAPSNSKAQPSIWRDVASPNPGAPAPPKVSDTVFNDASAASVTDAWAVGQRQVGLQPRAVAALWDGTTWTAASLPKISGLSSFSSVIDLGPGDAWAVGQRGNAKVRRTLVEHWDGSSWQVVATPNPIKGKYTTDEFQAVAGTAPHNIWAFGAENGPGGAGLFYSHLVEGSWVVTQGPAGALVWKAATAVTSDDVWAVGDNAGSDTTFSVNWNGNSWSVVLTPQLGSGLHVSNFVTGISGAPANLWASGYDVDDDPSDLWTPYVLHDTGSGWKLTQVPTSGEQGSLLTGVSVVSPTDVWAVGQTQQLDGSILSLTEKYNGSAWTILPSINPGTLGPTIETDLTSVTTSGAHNVPPSATKDS